MSHALMCVATFLALSSAGVSAEQDEDRDATDPVTIYARFVHERSAQMFAALQSELAAIMRPAGVSFEWRDLDGQRGNEVAAEIVVVSFLGNCDNNELTVPKQRDRSLGWTHVSDGEILPFSDVDCDRVRRLIQPVLAGVPRDERDGILGRALGRVLAHELYHVFADTTKHTSHGIAKGFYTARELVSKSLRFEADQTRALREGKLRHLFVRHSQPDPISAGSNQ